VSKRLADIAPQLECLLSREGREVPAFAPAQIKRETTLVVMRDGVRLATDLYLPPKLPGPVIAMRTPYGRRANQDLIAVFLAFACRGYVVISQDCRGTGDSEPDSWDYYLFESEDGYDLIEWISAQAWFDGFVGSCGGSYVGQTQWGMALHPAMATIVPEVSGLGIAVNTTHLYMFLNIYAGTVGKRSGKSHVSYAELERIMLPETLAGGYFNEPLYHALPAAVLARWPELREQPPSQAKRNLWKKYCELSCAGRAAFVKEVLKVENVSIAHVESLSEIFGYQIPHDAHSIPHASEAELARTVHAPPLIITGWYDWGLNDALASWALLQLEGRDSVRERARLIITPGSHNAAGYHEGSAKHPELVKSYRLERNWPCVLQWFEAFRAAQTAEWPAVIYYLMGANEWRTATAWPPPETQQLTLFLGLRTLSTSPRQARSEPDRYTYDPGNPTPTVGGSILSTLYPLGSVDVSEVQQRADVLTYTTAALAEPLDVVGPLRCILYVSSTAPDTDFSARLSDVFPDGRAIQLQSGILRARYRSAEPQLLEPGKVYCLQIDMWATANRFARGHHLRLDISSADFPRFDRNSNRGGEPGAALPAQQMIYHDAEHPSHLLLSIIGGAGALQ